MEVPAITALLTKAHASGLKRPALMAGDLQIKAGRFGSDAMVRQRVGKGWRGQGNIEAGVFVIRSYTTPQTKELMAKLQADPAATLKEIGKKTGTCCCCGRLLRDPVSVAAGIGPDCAKTWGL